MLPDPALERPQGRPRRPPVTACHHRARLIGGFGYFLVVRREIEKVRENVFVQEVTMFSLFSLFFAAATAIAALLSPLSQITAPSAHHQAQTQPSTPSTPYQAQSQPATQPATPSYTAGDPSNGSGTGAACTTVQGYYPAGLPGHEDSSGFCVAD